MEIPEPPPCPPKIYGYLMLLRSFAMTNRPIKGHNTDPDEKEGEGTVVNASDCPECPPCP